MSHMVTSFINGQISFNFVEIKRIRNKLAIRKVKKLRNVYARAN
ncbi:Uncharacterised protein [uncultured archaeon]|nr:Uncharacterised protein [uncultured archaeon]